MINESFYQEDIAILNMYAQWSSKIYKQKLMELKGKINKSTITVEDFSSPFSAMVGLDRKSTRIQKNSMTPSTKRTFIKHFTQQQKNKHFY